MFYKHVEKAWRNGEVRIGLSANGTFGDVTFETSGFTQLACVFLNKQEKEQIKQLAIADAQKKREQEENALKESIRKKFPSLPMQANPMLIDAALEECKSYYSQYGFERLYLIGSRARGDARPDSDHDFVVVVSDSAPDEIVRDNGAYGHLGISRIRKSVSSVDKGSSSPDVVIIRLSNFLARKDTKTEGFPYYAEHEGFKIY